MELINTIKDIGLTEKEAKIYLTLLQLNEALPGSIAKRSGIKRPTTYVTLENLQKKGLVSHILKGKNLYYQAINPKSLVVDQQTKLKKIEQALPELLTLNKKFTSIPQMSVYEGKEGLIQIMEDTLTTKTDLLCWCDIELAVYTILEDYYPSYIKSKVEKKVFLKGVFSYDKRSVAFKKKGSSELREVYLIPKEKFPFKNEINIYDDKVAIISHQDQIGVIIQNQHIADTQKAIFNLGFEYAKILEKEILTKEDIKFLNSK